MSDASDDRRDQTKDAKGHHPVVPHRPVTREQGDHGHARPARVDDGARSWPVFLPDNLRELDDSPESLAADFDRVFEDMLRRSEIENEPPAVRPALSRLGVLLRTSRDPRWRLVGRL